MELAKPPACTSILLPASRGADPRTSTTVTSTQRSPLSTAAIAAYTAVPNGTEIATVELSINYLEPVPGGRIKADARVLRAGRNFIVTECEIFNENGSLAAKALLTFGATAGHSLYK